MLSVTQIIPSVQQPEKGYVPIKLFDVIEYQDGEQIYDVESAMVSIMGMATDYLTRYMMGTRKTIAFQISLMGARRIDEVNEDIIEIENATRLLNGINGLDDKSIYNACQIVGYDVAYRKGVKWFEDVNLILPSEQVIHNIKIMVNRSLEFIKKYGPIVLDGFTFEGGYTDLVSSGDGDYLTDDTLWDFKVSTKKISTKWSLQLIMYYILGIHSIHKEFKNIKNIGIFNPLQNKVYIAKLENIEDESFYNVSKNVLGYKMSISYKYDEKEKRIIEDYSCWKDILGSDKKSVQRFFTNNFVTTNFKVDDFEDGIYDISVDDYWTYYRDVIEKDKFRMKPLFTKTDYIKFIKRNGYVMFMSVSSRGSISILHGARLRRATFPVEYYYENIEKYAQKIIDTFSKYWEALHLISQQVKQIKPDEKVLKKTRYSEYVQFQKSIGNKYDKFDKWYEEQGQFIHFDGHIHGCIVDLDFSNHIYLNPNDGTIVPYNAYSMYDKNIYKNLPSLIAAQRPEMLPGYKKIIKENKNSLIASNVDEKHNLIVMDDSISEEVIKVYSYDMYEVSNRLKALQNIYDYGLVSVWYDNVLGVSIALPKAQSNSLLGQTEKMNCGMNATVVEDNGFRDITVKFEDGTLVEKTTREAFRKKRIKNPKLIIRKEVIKREKKNFSYVGKSNIMHCGLKATVIEDNGCKNITIQFEDGKIRKHCRREHFDLGKIAYSNLEE